MDFVIDASIAAAWILEDEQSELADRVIDSLVSKTAAAQDSRALGSRKTFIPAR